MTLTKADLIEVVANKLIMPKKDAKEIVELFFNQITDVLEEGEDIKFSGFGNFVLNDKDERPGRNPKTGEDYTISARRVVTFKAGPKLKDTIDFSQKIEELPTMLAELESEFEGA